MIYFLLQGLSQAIYDLTGISIVLNLWSEINSSPLNALQGKFIDFICSLEGEQS